MKMNKLLAALGGIALMVTLLLTAVDLCCFFKPFYHYEYAAGKQAEKIGMSEEGLNEATDALLDYLHGSRDDIFVETEVYGEKREVYNQREKLHTIDVRNLYQSAVMIRNVLAITSLLIFLYLYWKNHGNFPVLFKNGLKHGFLCLLLLVLFVSVWAIADFDAFWLNFHYVFFDNDLFLLDPNTSIMINMFPSVFFMHMVFMIIFVYGLFALGAYGLANLLCRRRTA
ncbi:MAG: TIGR01906 family membrane protein [Solobacterium sp.]|nr:TIGR01906 family membrane protein [Solobacterium sp.]